MFQPVISQSAIRRAYFSDHAPCDATGLTVPTVSVVICTRNGALRLPWVLDAVAVQHLPEGVNVEVVVVDDGSTDTSADVARKHGARVVELRPGRGIAAARNTGLWTARGDLVAFTDDDCLPQPGWIGALVRGFEDPTVVGVGGRTTALRADTVVLRFLALKNPLLPLVAEYGGDRSMTKRLLRYLALGSGPTHKVPDGSYLAALPTANVLLRADHVRDIGGFDEGFSFGSEDEDLCRRIISARGLKSLVYRADAHVYHDYRPGLRALLRRAWLYGVGSMQLAQKTPEVRVIAYPGPLVTGLSSVCLFLFRRRWVEASAALLGLPPLLYPRWIPCAVRERAVVVALFPYLELLQDTTAMMGELQGLSRRYNPGA
jgi:glycosyltransferase involved in cell wall biosynthesis